MKEGILEVLLVNAEGFGYRNFIGKPWHYVILQCGDQTHKSKTTTGKNKKAFWNEKFEFKIPFSDCQKLCHLKLRIMEKEIFTNDGFVGETIVHLGGILTEGIDKGFIEVKPSAYNIVLEDDTFKGEIKVGIKFVANEEVQRETVCAGLDRETTDSYGTFFSFWRFLWWRFFSPTKNTSMMQ